MNKVFKVDIYLDFQSLETKFAIFGITNITNTYIAELYCIEPCLVYCNKSQKSVAFKYQRLFWFESFQPCNHDEDK